MSVAETHKEHASSDFRDRVLNVVVGQGMIDEPDHACVRGHAEYSQKVMYIYDSKMTIATGNDIEKCSSKYKAPFQLLFVKIDAVKYAIMIS